MEVVGVQAMSDINDVSIRVLFDHLRQFSGGRLRVDQVDSINRVLDGGDALPHLYVFLVGTNVIPYTKLLDDQAVRRALPTEFYSRLRGVLGRVTQEQVDAGNRLIEGKSTAIIADLKILFPLYQRTLHLDLNDPELVKVYKGTNLAFIPVIEELAPKYKINTPSRMMHYLTQMIHESNGFTALRERMNYSPQRLRAVFPTRVRTDAVAKQLSAQGEKAIANFLYGGRYGNTQPDDGWNFRGGGLTHLTFRANYRNAGNAIGVPLESNPDLIQQPRIAVETSMHFWDANGLNQLADLGGTDDIVRKVSIAINGGLNGIDHRQILADRLQTLERLGKLFLK